MAEEKESKTTKQDSSYQLQVIGPKNDKSGSQVLKFEHDDQRKTPITMIAGQVINVGGKDSDLSQAEADRLQRSSTWEFKKV